jgi:GNAT superfamily N-acetyltransferase
MSKYTIHHALPSVEQFIRLRKICGLRPPPPENVGPALAASLHSIIAQSPSGETVGTVRAIGDGHLYVQVVDMAVHPSHQRQGIGKRMLDEMIGWIDRECGNVYTSLIAMPGSEDMYRKVGFVETGGRGMKRTKWPKTGVVDETNA